MKKTTLLAVLLTMALVAAVPAVAQISGGDPTIAPGQVAGQYDNSTCEISGVTPFGHVPGEILVLYYSGEIQTLHFEEIASIPDPCERLAAEEAKLQEVRTWPEVRAAGFNNSGQSIDPEPIGPG